MTAGIFLLFLPLAARCSSFSFSPASGQAGNVVTIIGSGIGSATLVEFNTNTPTLADFTNVSANELLVVVPQAVTNGGIGVLVGGVWSYSASNFLAAPVISSFSPPSGANPTMVYILGANFISGATSVVFPGVSAPVAATYVGPTEIEATVPVGAGNGPLTVITSAGTNVSPTNFLASSVPTITSISPSAATNGQTVDIFGGNFFGGATVRFGTLAASIDIVSTTEIAATVPTGATSSNVIVTTEYGSATYSNFVTDTGPIITNFSPTVGADNTPVTITGFNLSTVTNVTINGVREYINAQTPLQITLTNNPGTGPIRVTAGTSSFTTPNNFTNSAAPYVTDFYPSLGPPGSTLTIDGLNFTSTTKVKFGATSATTTQTGQTQLSAVVPSIATGNYTIVVTNNSGSFTNSSNFTVTGAAPVITSFTPTNGVRGAMVTLNGANFTNLGASAVQFNGVTATYQTPTATTELMVTVPADVTTGFITVANSSGTGASPSLFYMQPWITSLSTNGGIVNSSFTITGRSLTGASSLLINGLSLTNFTVTTTQMIVTIPSNASSGPIEITTPGGIYISTNNFGILPKIYSFSPVIGPAGTVVTISGTSLFDVTSVEFGGVATADFTAGTNQLQVVVPANAASGPLTVVTPYGNDVSTNSFTVTKSSLVLLTKTAIPIVEGPGTNMTYLLVVTNEGPSIISSTVVTDTLPLGFTFVSATTATGSWVNTNGNLIWNIGILTNNTTASLDIVGTASSATSLTNSAVLAFAEGNLAYYNNYATIVNYFVTDSQRTLSITRQANPPGLLLSWPLSSVNFQLQTNNGSNLNNGWSTLSNGVFISNSLNTFTDSFAAPQTFFRLTLP